MSSSVPNRDVLARVFRDHQSLRAFETLFRQVNTELPGAVDGVANTLAEVSTEVVALNLVMAAVAARIAELETVERRLTQQAEQIEALSLDLELRIAAIEQYEGVAWH
jgi:hypothetical protein